MVVATVEGHSLMIAEDGLLFDRKYNYHLLLGPSEMRQVLRRHALESGVQIYEGHNCKGVIRDQDNRIIGVKVSTPDGKNAGEEMTTQISCNLLIGADGYRSNLRKEFQVRYQERLHKSLVTAFFVECVHHLDRMKMLLGDGYMIVILPCTESRLCLGYTEKEKELSFVGNPIAFT